MKKKIKKIKIKDLSKIFFKHHPNTIERKDINWENTADELEEYGYDPKRTGYITLRQRNFKLYIEGNVHLVAVLLKMMNPGEEIEVMYMEPMNHIAGKVLAQKNYERHRRKLQYKKNTDTKTGN